MKIAAGDGIRSAASNHSENSTEKYTVFIMLHTSPIA